MKTLKIEDLKIKNVKSAHSDLRTTKNAIERFNKRFESGREIHEGQMNEYNIIMFCIESGKEVIADYLEAAVCFSRDNYEEALETLKKGM